MTVSARAIAVEGVGFSTHHLAFRGFVSADDSVTASTAFILWRNRPATTIRATQLPVTKVTAVSHPATTIRSTMCAATVVQTSSRPTTRINARLPTLPLHVDDVSYVDIFVRDGHTDELIDPTVVSIKVLEPLGSDATYVYATHAEVTRSAVGTYRAAIPCTTEGRWDFAVICTGPVGIGVEPGYFDVVIAT